MNEIDQLQDLYDMARRSIDRARREALTPARVAEIRHREGLMEVIAAEIFRLKGDHGARNWDQ